MKLKLSPPWVEFAHEVKALFKGDKEVRVIYDDEEKVISLYVDNAQKAEALTGLLPETKEFGGVTVKLTVIPANGLTGAPVQDVWQTAFSGNPQFSGVKFIQCPLGNFTYIIWRPSAVQFFNDNLGDVNGNQTMLVQDVARDVFTPQIGIYHCSAQLFGAPLGEWP